MALEEFIERLLSDELDPDRPRIGVLTSGGDCPGLNAVLRAATKSAFWLQAEETPDEYFQNEIERCRGASQ